MSDNDLQDLRARVAILEKDRENILSKLDKILDHLSVLEGTAAVLKRGECPSPGLCVPIMKRLEALETWKSAMEAIKNQAIGATTALKAQWVALGAAIPTVVGFLVWVIRYMEHHPIR